MGERYRRAERWFEAHPVGEFVLLALVPGLAYAASELWLSGEGPARAITLGIVFGLTFAIVTVAMRRALGR